MTVDVFLQFYLIPLVMALALEVLVRKGTGLGRPWALTVWLLFVVAGSAPLLLITMIVAFGAAFDVTQPLIVWISLPLALLWLVQIARSLQRVWRMPKARASR